MDSINFTNKKQTKAAFVSLFTVLMATVILAIAIGMSSIALKQIVLASTADEANEAFYSADAGIQCAIMQDFYGAYQIGGPDTVTCGSVDTDLNDSDTQVFTYGLNGQGFDWPSGNCVKIIVKKDALMTEIESFGYNVSCDQLDSPRVVERALRVRYGG